MLVTCGGTTYPLPKDGKYGCVMLPGAQHDATDGKSKAPQEGLVEHGGAQGWEQQKAVCRESEPGFLTGKY